MKKVMIILSLFIGTSAFAQQDILYTQYMYNKLALNPAYAGSQEIFAMDLLTRIQWVGIEGAPRSISFTAHTPLRNPHIGLGLSAYRDQLGPSIEYGAMGTFAYRVIFPTTKLCFGISAGFMHTDLDWASLTPKTSGDFELNSQVRNKVVPDADFGIYYYGTKFYVGVSSKHLIQSQTMVASSAPAEGEYNYTKLLRHFYGMAGGAFPLSEHLVFMPSILCKYVANSPFQTDLNVNFLIYDVLTLGASFRTEKALGLIVGVNITKNLTFSYSYDIWFNELQAYNKGSHEIRLGFGFDLFNKDRMLTPRYF
ncbi:MAG: type IX secretion system membrane protein PorP/SprF [Bacteroidetes bacterium]|nr:type IX secretion system membrane protein PorP/SprF [Bacteroidota bacterium]